jgi:hypothetical protein
MTIVRMIIQIDIILPHSIQHDKTIDRQKNGSRQKYFELGRIDYNIETTSNQISNFGICTLDLYTSQTIEQYCCF